MNDPRIGAALGAIAERAVPDDLDLWPAVAARVAGRRPRRRRLARAFALAAALLVAALVPLAVPAARAAVGGWLQRSGILLLPREAIEKMPTPPPRAPGTFVVGPGVVGAVGPARKFAGLPLDEVRRRAAFPVCAPSWLPDGLQVVGGDVGPDGSAAVRFASAPDAMPGGGIQQIPGTLRGWYGAPAEHAEAVAVRGQPATFVRGAWEKDGRWHPESDAGLLSWEANGITYVLMFSGLGLSREEVVRIAESCVPA
ncbi:MAG TPA: hypothetical protein VG370_28015 [Chloroflexota bacterium]|nr:hypothetical protein [Chloroflexota bacterium]